MEYTQKSENRFADALATLGSQVPFKGKDTLVRIGKQEHSIIKVLKTMFPKGILSQCINEKEGKLRLEELHSQCISLYKRMQHMGYYWPNMSKEAATIQEKCQKCLLSIDKEESYAVFVTEDWRTPFMEYLA